LISASSRRSSSIARAARAPATVAHPAASERSIVRRLTNFDRLSLPIAVPA
jgi:hypothetical protein